MVRYPDERERQLELLLLFTLKSTNETLAGSSMLSTSNSNPSNAKTRSIMDETNCRNLTGATDVVDVDVEVL